MGHIFLVRVMLDGTKSTPQQKIIQATSTSTYRGIFGPVTTIDVKMPRWGRLLRLVGRSVADDDDDDDDDCDEVDWWLPDEGEEAKLNEDDKKMMMKKKKKLYTRSPVPGQSEVVFYDQAQCMFLIWDSLS